MIVITSFILLIGSFGTQLSFTIFLKPLTEEFSWTRAATSGVERPARRMVECLVRATMKPIVGITVLAGMRFLAGMR